MEQTVYLENLRVIAASHHFRVAVQTIEILCIKYGLNDEQRQEMLRYCAANRITLYDQVEEEKKKEAESLPVISEEEREAEALRSAERRTTIRLSREVAGWLVNCGANKTRKKMEAAGEHGWLCGTYASSLESIYEGRVQRIFSLEDLTYIIEHMPPSAREASFFELSDPEDPDRCDKLNEQLNQLIPYVRLNHSLRFDHFD